MDILVIPSSNASVAGRVGGGNIAGVAVAISLGGAGAIILDVGYCTCRYGYKFL